MWALLQNTQVGQRDTGQRLRALKWKHQKSNGRIQRKRKGSLIEWKAQVQEKVDQEKGNDATLGMERCQL